ncbi:TetR/AcrR family transcriptional regulator [Halobaculum gomorrense]|uniref:Transcriptional regulator, TetR family n=1 Tax=Halobaculum gomorrense TaxID=43928 RepID=A0A1M5SUK0_9EURY|nr:TetR/AcrR family transcriptional regulator [Halobaculum gomorrense]SHH42186.1 transcriptional regulator, TetR family [Halobaculum gomorrense]
MSDGTNGGPDASDEGDESNVDGGADVNTLIMEATYCALCEHGYAELSVSHIAAEFEKSKSLLYYHYDSKDDLIAGFLRFAGDHFLAMLDEAEREADSAVGRIHAFVDIYLGAEVDDRMAEAQRAMIDLRAQAVSEPRFREEFTRIDDHLRERLETAIADGVASGAIDETIDPEEAATWLLSTLTGAMLQRHTADYDVVTPVRRMLHGYVDEFARASAATDTDGDTVDPRDPGGLDDASRE